MSKNLITIYMRIDPDLKKKTHKQAIDLDLLYRDFVALALAHYSDHVEKNEINFDENIFKDEE
jgi:hypothetical protein